MNNFNADQPDINQDMQVWYSIILKHLDQHAPVKHKRVKSNRLPEWLNEDIVNAQKHRDNFKRLNQWSEYKKYRNKVTTLIRKAKRNHFSESISNSKDTKMIWKLLKSVSQEILPTTYQKRLPLITKRLLHPRKLRLNLISSLHLYRSC